MLRSLLSLMLSGQRKLKKPNKLKSRLIKKTVKEQLLQKPWLKQNRKEISKKLEFLKPNSQKKNRMP